MISKLIYISLEMLITCNTDIYKILFKFYNVVIELSVICLKLNAYPFVFYVLAHREKVNKCTFAL